MPATPIAATTRYFRPETSKVYFVNAMASYLTPTRAELNAGTDLSDEVAAVEGFQVTGETIDTPDMGSTFTGKIPGRTTADDSSLTFYASDDSADVRTLLPRGTTGYVVWLDEGDTQDYKMDVYPVRVVSAPKIRDLEDAAKITINFAVTRVPAENVTIPA